MDAVEAGLIGSLGGVLLGGALQLAHSGLSRKWRKSDQYRERSTQIEDLRRNERRSAYVDLLETTQTVFDRATTNTIYGDKRECADHLGDLLTEAVRAYNQVLLTTNSKTVYLAAESLHNAMWDLIDIGSSSSPDPSISFAAARADLLEEFRNDLGLPRIPPGLKRTEIQTRKVKW